MPRGKKKKKVVEISPPPVRGRKTRRRAISHSPVRSPISPSSPENTHSEEAEMAEQNNHNVSDYATPKLDGLQHSIRRSSIQANNFEIKPATIQLLQANGQFGGSPIDDPNNHILNFLEICDTFKHNGVSDDAIRLRLFPFSLRDKAKVWLQSLPEGSISTREELAQQFLTKYFPPGKTAKMRNDITSFVLLDNESLYEAWERFKELLRKCPHHGLPKWLQVQTFYNGLSSEIRTSIDAAAGGALMSKPVDAAYTLLETMSSNNYQWHSDRHVHARVAGVQDSDMFASLSSQIAALTKEVKSLGQKVVASKDQMQRAPLGYAAALHLKCKGKMFGVSPRPSPPSAAVFDRCSPPSRATTHFHLANPFTAFLSLFLHFFSQFFLYSKPNSTIPDPVFSRSPPSPTATALKSHHLPPLFISKASIWTISWSMTSRKRKATASSTSSGTIAERFASPDAAKRYKDIFSKAKAISERGLCLNKENNDDKEILDMVDTLEWKKFAAPPKQQGHLTIVREFYANFKDRKDNKVNVRGVEIPFSREDIIKFYNLPNLPQEECGYHALQEQEAPDYGAITEKLGKEADTSWENSKAKRDRQPLKLLLMNLKDVVSLWQHFICAHIIPGGNTSVVTKERAFLLYCIVTGQQIDVAEIMMNQVVQAAEKSNPTLFFPCLITALCKKAHVKFSDTDALMSKKWALNLAKIKSARQTVENTKHRGAFEEFRQNQRQQEAFAPHLESAPSSSAQPEADHLIRELLERQERYHQEVMAEMKYLRAQ
ncbi:uncharacterized protein G2W53_042193 [Senna tora]|uniref:Retrotransposon gag domain-containing protein n=1 Tax=Senna tora TaxID=362788 RepID=A0A834SGM8_9FABA|nr:uncharacterized protein G2W53_042193 [Senna tora]